MRLSRFIMVSAMCLAAVSVFGSGTSEKSGSVPGRTEITYMCWYNTTQSESANTQKVIDAFNAEQDKIFVRMIAVPRDGYETKVNTLAAGKQLPDCTQLSEAMAIEFAAAGLLADLHLVHKATPSVGDKSAMPSLDLTLLTGKVAMATSEKNQWDIIIIGTTSMVTWGLRTYWNPGLKGSGVARPPQRLILQG